MSSSTPRGATGARCQIPGCGARAVQGRAPAQITVNGHAVTVERVCAEHRRALRGPTRKERRRTSSTSRPSTSSGSVRYRCHGCGQTHATYRAAEHCVDAHAEGGARISCDVHE